MGQSIQKQDMLSVPSGGIADFYMSDEAIAAIEQEEAQKAFGSEGVAAFDGVAKRMASYGRFGDDRIVHVESGEIVVPRALIEQSPELKESIFSHLREQGVEDPERYVVGSSANSLNPETGLPEFFLSKIVKGVKKAFKGVGKVLKKVAPVVLPLVLASTPLGPVYGAAMGSGISTLIQGGSAEDALKSAVIAGGTGALFKGFTGDAGSFGKNVSAAFSDPVGRFSQTLSGDGGFFGDYKPVTAPPITSDPSTGLPDYTVSDSALGDTSPGSKISALESIQETIMPSDPTSAQIAQKSQELMSINPKLTSSDAIALAQKELTPGFLRKYGPSIALAGLGAGALGAFDAPEVEEEEYVTGADLLAQNPEKYGFAPEQLRYLPDYNPFVPPPDRRVPVMQAAEGGVVGGLRGLAEYSEDVVGNLNQMMYGGQGPSSTATAAPTLPPIAPPAATAPSGPLFGGGGTAVSSMPAPITAVPVPPTPPNPSGPSFGTRPNEFNLTDQMLRLPPTMDPRPSVSPINRTPGIGGGSGPVVDTFVRPENYVGNPAPNIPTPNLEERILSLNDMSLLGMATPTYMPLDRGDGMDQFGRPIQSQLTDAERSQAKQDQTLRQEELQALLQERRNQPSSSLFSNLGISGLASLGPNIFSGYAEGGEIFPRRTGGIMPDEGVPDKDSVRAMLMPGEFVMTTDAVKGLGNGDNDQGIRKMYDMMRGLEAKGKAMA
jgi:hypothetical protein